MSSIQINFQRALNQARELDELANRLNTVAKNQLGDSMHQLSANWKSDNASRFLSKGATLQGEISSTAVELRQIAESIRTAATRIRNVELEAKRIAEERAAK